MLVFDARVVVNTIVVSQGNVVEGKSLSRNKERLFRRFQFALQESAPTVDIIFKVVKSALWPKWHQVFVNITTSLQSQDSPPPKEFGTFDRVAVAIQLVEERDQVVVAE